jgi:hypothetical protein
VLETSVSFEVAIAATGAAICDRDTGYVIVSFQLDLAGMQAGAHSNAERLNHLAD